MSLKALLFLATYFGGLGLAFVYPIIGLMTYLWAFYQYPQNRWWGEEVPELRWSLIAGLVTLIATIFSVNMTSRQPVSIGRHDHHSAPIWNAGFIILALFTTWMWIQSPWAADPEAHQVGCLLFTKYVVLFGLFQYVLDGRRSLEWFFFANVIGATVWGITMWQSDAGQARIELILGPGVEDANTGSLHLAACAGFAGMLLIGWDSRLRWVALAALPFILNGVILTGSRGGLLGLFAAGIIAVFLGPRHKKSIVVACAVLGAVLFFQLASETFWDRMATLRPGEEETLETSAASRLVVNRGNWNMFLDHPFGVGHRGDIVISPQYMPGWVLNSGIGLRAAHNTMLAVLSNHGVPGIVLFGALHVWAAITLLRLKRLDRLGLPTSLGAMRASIGAGITAYVICGLFSNYIKAEVAIWCFALIPLLQRECIRWKHDTQDRTSTAVRDPVRPAVPVGTPGNPKRLLAPHNGS